MPTTLQPVTYLRRSYRPVRVIWHIAASVVLVVLLQHPLAGSADAGPRRARLSADLSAHLAAGSGEIDVIVSGSVEKIDRLAARHGLRIKKTLSSGAVFTVSRQSLDALSQDLDVETLSGNSTVRSAMAK